MKMARITRKRINPHPGVCLMKTVRWVIFAVNTVFVTNTTDVFEIPTVVRMPSAKTTCAATFADAPSMMNVLMATSVTPAPVERSVRVRLRPTAAPGFPAV